ncbi:MAG: hypothetical protein KBB88_02465 [Candidatus Pacebacteria bacterium]|nr:hypothetical protein [Candidatus Paceibacterota bacterium]
MNNQTNNTAPDTHIGFDELEKFLKEYHVQAIQTTLFDKISTLVFVALGLITALAWEETFKGVFVFIFGGVESLGQKALYALMLTVVTVVISVYFGKYVIKKREM